MSTSSGRWHSRTCEASSSIPDPRLDNIILFSLFLRFRDGVTALDGQSKKGRPRPPANEEADPAHDPRGWIVPGHHEAGVAHRQAHQRTDEQWDLNLEAEAFLTEVADKVDAIEHENVHWGQAMQMLADLKMNGCAEDASLTIQRLPASAALVDRARIEETRSAASLDPCIKLARELLMEELQKRFFDERPSDAAMILMQMTKQGLPASAYLSAPMSALARTIYLKWLRNAHDVLRGKLPMPLRTSPRKATIANPSKLFRTSCIAAEDADFDEVTDEMARWDSLNSKEIECFRKADGLIDEFALMWAMRLRFPLHFFLFKQTACHLPFEANVERVFSVAGYLSDPCRHAEHLVDMVMAALNRKAYDPSIEAIRAQYYEMFRGIAGAESVAVDSDSDSSN